MPVSFVLVGGGGISVCTAAITLARHGWEVALAAGSPLWAGGGIVVDADDASVLRRLGLTGSLLERGAEDVEDELLPMMLALGLEVRRDIGLLGFIDVDDFVEAEFSNGRVKNYDAIVIAGAIGGRSYGWCVVANSNEDKNATAVALALTDVHGGSSSLC